MADVNDSVDTNREVTSAMWSVPLIVSENPQIRRRDIPWLQDPESLVDPSDQIRAHQAQTTDDNINNLTSILPSFPFPPLSTFLDPICFIAQPSPPRQGNRGQEISLDDPSFPLSTPYHSAIYY